MLKEIDQNMAIETSSPPADTPPESTLMGIHQTNVFKPHELVVSCMSTSPERVHLAIRRGYLHLKDINCPFSQLDFYDITSKSQPKYVHTIIEYEDITGLAWLNEKHLISVSAQATINIYNLKTGSKVRVMTTDFGPICCMKLSAADNLLVTGTEYGYVAVYKVDPKDRSIELISKLVKISDPISAIDFHIKARPTPIKKPTLRIGKPSDLLKHAKRKHNDSSDESEDDEDDTANDQNKAEGNFMEMSDLTIYGGTLDKVHAWDFHRTTIIDTLMVGNKVTSVIVLQSGNIAVGDEAGYLGIIDQATFTCRQNDRLLNSSILTLSTNSKSSTIVVAGKEPMIAILEIDKSSETKDVYILREKLKDHSNDICCSLFSSKKEFFTGAADNQVIKFRLSKADGRQQLKRFRIVPQYKNKLNFNFNEVMATFGKSLQIFKYVPDNQTVPDIPTRRALTEPQRICTVRASAYVHAAAHDDKWICYATSGAVKILDRPNLSRVDTTEPNLPACQIMRLCQSGRFLVIGQQRKLIIVGLKDGFGDADGAVDPMETTSSADEGVSLASKKPIARGHKAIFTEKFSGTIRNVLYYPDSNQLVVSCGTMSHSLYILRLPSAAESSDVSKNKIKILFKTSARYPIMHMARNIYKANDSNLYIYTSKDQLIRCDILSATFKKDLDEKMSQQERVSGLSKDVGIQGLMTLTSNHCLINDNIYIYKVNLDTNEIVNSTMDFKEILTMDNSIFNKQNDMLVVSTA